MVKDMENTKKDNRCRNWQIVFYPESAPDNFEDIIYSWHIPCLLSPLHNPINNKSIRGDTENKPHYHLNILLDGKSTYEDIYSYAEQLNTKRIERIKSKRTMNRYLIHFDDKDKEQFKIEDIISFGGCEYISDFESDNYSVNCCEELEKLILTNRIENFAKLIIYLREHDKSDLINYIRFKNAYYIESLLKGVWLANKNSEILTEESDIFL